MAQSQTFANLDPVLKENYGVGLKNAINNVNALASMVQPNDRDLIGRRAVWALHTGRSASSGNRAEGGALPTAAPQNYAEPIEKLVFAYHTIKITGQAQELTRGDEGAFVRGLESELRGAEADIKNDYARQQFGQKLTNGTSLQSGVLAALSTGPASGAIWTFANATESEMLYFFIGELLQAINPANGAVRAGVGTYTVTAIAIDAKTVTITPVSDASVASGDYIVRQGNFGTEINGLRHLISAQVFAGIDPAVVPSWGAITAGSTTTQISEVALDDAKTRVRTRGNGATPDTWVCDPYQERKLITQLITQRRYDAARVTVGGSGVGGTSSSIGGQTNAGTVGGVSLGSTGQANSYAAGWDGVKIAQGVLISDKFCPTTTVFGLTIADIERFVGLEWSWDDSGGSVLYKALDNSDAVEARFRCYHQWAATNRNSHVALTLAVPVF